VDVSNIVGWRFLLQLHITKVQTTDHILLL